MKTQPTDWWTLLVPIHLECLTQAVGVEERTLISHLAMRFNLAPVTTSFLTLV